MLGTSAAVFTAMEAIEVTKPRRRFDPTTGRPIVRHWSSKRFAEIWDEEKAKDPSKTMGYLVGICRVSDEKIRTWKNGTYKPDCDELELLAFALNRDPDEFKVWPRADENRAASTG